MSPDHYKTYFEHKNNWNLKLDQDIVGSIIIEFKKFVMLGRNRHFSLEQNFYVIDILGSNKSDPKKMGKQTTRKTVLMLFIFLKTGKRIGNI